jgi:hypothetical protein
MNPNPAAPDHTAPNPQKRSREVDERGDRASSGTFKSQPDQGTIFVKFKKSVLILRNGIRAVISGSGLGPRPCPNNWYIHMVIRLGKFSPLGWLLGKGCF